SPLEDLSCRVGRPQSSTNLAWKFGTEPFYELPIVSAAHCGVKIDHLNNGKLAEAPNPLWEVIEFEGFAFTLDKLHDFAAHEIDGRDQHGNLMGMPCACNSVLRARMFSIPKWNMEAA